LISHVKNRSDVCTLKSFYSVYHNPIDALISVTFSIVSDAWWELQGSVIWWSSYINSHQRSCIWNGTRTRVLTNVSSKL